MFATTRQHSSPKFRKWVELESKKSDIAKAIEGVEFPEKVFDYLSIAFGKVNQNTFWKNSVFSLNKAFQENHVELTVPMVKAQVKQDKGADWEYEGRTWNYFSHILANAYGWTLEYIGNLGVNEALAHIQEVLTDEQLDKEFVYSLSDIAYPYNKSTKKGEFKPMPRPHWMRPSSKPLKKVKIKRSLLPVGYGVDVSGMAVEAGWGALLENNNETKETDTSRNPSPVPDP